MTITFFVIGIAVVYCIINLIDPIKNVINDNINNQEEKQRAEDANPIIEQYNDGFIYEYSKEEIENFKKLIIAQLEEEKVSINVKPGQMRDSAGMASISAYSTDKDRDDYAYNIIFTTFGDYIDYDPKELKPGDMFNENLSLSKPDLFYGYASVGSNDIDLDKLNIDYSTEYLNDGNFEYFISFLEEKGNPEEFDGDKLYEELTDFIFNNKDILTSQYKIGGSKLIYDKWKNLDNKNYLNVLHSFLRIRPYTDGRIVNKFINEDVDANLDEYNFFVENKDPYFFYFYPTRIEKVNKSTYAIDIETTAPFTQRAMLMIITQIMNNFYTENQDYIKYQSNTTIEEYNDKCNKEMLQKEIRITDVVDFDIIIRINKTDLNKNLLIEGTEVSVFYPRALIENTDDALSLYNYVYDDFTVNSSTKKATLQFEIPWYPNEKARQVIKNYFGKINVLIENNENKTLNEVMKEVSDELDISLKDVKSIIYSYYYKYVHMS